MQIARVTRSAAHQFITYCRNYGKEHDDSFLPDDDFVPDESHPAYLLTEKEDIIGAVCLIRTKPFTDLGRGRFMIFHSNMESEGVYRKLLEAVSSDIGDLSYIYLFIPENRHHTRKIWEQLGFAVERYSYQLKRIGDIAQTPDLPEGYSFSHLERHDTAKISTLCALLNLNFTDMNGHVETSEREIEQLFSSPTYIPEGVILLNFNDEPIGTVQVCIDEDDKSATAIEMLSVHPGHRKKGLGRLLLRKSLEFSVSKNYNEIYLSVNAENERAVSLYLSEGFKKQRVYVCYGMRL
jgi:mycothiol synthase